MSTKNLFFSLHEEWETHGQSFTWQRIMKLLEQISSKVWENCRGLEPGPERGGTGSVIDHTMAKRPYKKKDHIATWLIGVFQKCFDSFELNTSLKITLVYFFLVTRSNCSCCFSGLVVLLFCSLMPKGKFLSFWSEIVKRLFGATHVLRRNFTFCSFVFFWWSLEFAPARGRTASCQCHLPSHNQLRLRKNWACQDLTSQFQFCKVPTVFILILLLFKFFLVQLLLFTKAMIDWYL